MAESVGAAVFTVDADISRFDQRLSEAQSRAVRAVQGINTSLQSIQGVDVVINQVGTLNLSNEINQIEAYKARLASLRGELAALKAPASMATTQWAPFGGMIDLASGRLVKRDKEIDEYMAKKRALKAEEISLNQKIMQSEQITTQGIKDTMIVRSSAIDKYQAKLVSLKKQQAVLQQKAISDMTIGTPEGLRAYENEMKSLQRKISAMEGSKFGRMLNLENDIKQIEALKKELDSLKLKLAGLRQGAISNLSLTTPGGLAKYEAEVQAIVNRIKIAEQELVAIENSTTASIEKALARRSASYTNMAKTQHEQGILARAAENRKKQTQTTGVVTGFEGTMLDADAMTKVDKKIDNIGEAAKKSHGPVSLLDRAFGRLTRTLFAFTGVYAFVELISSLHQAVSAGVEFNKTIENVKLGMGALLEAQGKFRQNGEILTGVEATNAALTMSSDIIKKLQYDNIQTIATFEQLARAYQSALAPGLAAGFNTEQVRQFSLAMVQAASAMQLPLDMMAEEMRSMLRGTITPRNTIIATNLGITNEDIRQYKGDAQGLFNFIMEKLDKFKTYGPLLQDSFAGLWSNMVDIFRMAAGEAGAPFFEFLKQVMRDITDYLVVIDNKTKKLTINPQFIEVLKDFYKLTELIAVSLGGVIGAVAGLMASLGRMLGLVESVFKPILDFVREWQDENRQVSQELTDIGEAIAKVNEKIIQNQSLHKGGSGLIDITGLEIPNTVMASPEDKSRFDEERYVAAIKKYKSEYSSLLSVYDTIAQKQEEGTPWSSDQIQQISEFSKTIVLAMRTAVSEMQDWIKHIDEATIASDGLHSKSMDVGISIRGVSHEANVAAKDLKDYVKWLKEARDIDISKTIGQDLKTRLEAKKEQLQMLQETGDKPLAKLDFQYKMQRKSLEQAYELSWTPEGAAEGGTPSDIRRELNWLDKIYDVDKEILAEEEKIKSSRKKSGGGGRPVSVEKMANEMRELEKEKEKWNRKLLDMDTDYDIKRLEASGRTFDAQIMQIDQQSKAQMEEYQSNIDDLQAKITEYRAKNLDENARNELNKTATMLDFLKEKQEEYNSKIKRRADLEKDLAKQQDQAQRVKEITDLNLQYAEMVGTREEILALTIKQIEAEAELRKIENPQYAEEIERNKKAQIARTKALEGEDFGAGFMVTARDAFQELGGWGQIGSDAFTMLSDSISSTADTLTEFLTTGKIEFADFANSIIKDMIRIITQRLIMNAVFGVINLISPLSGGATGGGAASGGIGNLLSGSKIMSTQAFHNGLGTVSKMVPDSYFFNAPRLHDGLAADEYPAILQKGEAVIPKNHSLANTSNITVNITQNGDSGNASDAQILAKIVAKAVDEKIQQSFRKQMRNGGILDSHKRVA